MPFHFFLLLLYNAQAVVIVSKTDNTPLVNPSGHHRIIYKPARYCGFCKDPNMDFIQKSKGVVAPALNLAIAPKPCSGPNRLPLVIPCEFACYQIHEKREGTFMRGCVHPEFIHIIGDKKRVNYSNFTKFDSINPPGLPHVDITFCTATTCFYSHDDVKINHFIDQALSKNEQNGLLNSALHISLTVSWAGFAFFLVSSVILCLFFTCAYLVWRRCVKQRKKSENTITGRRIEVEQPEERTLNSLGNSDIVPYSVVTYTADGNAVFNFGNP